MAVKISQLSASTSITSDDFFPVVDSGSLSTKRASAQQILDYVTGSTFNTLTVTSLTSSNVTGSTAMFTSITGTHAGSGAGLTNIPNSALVNNSVTVGSTTISLGTSATTIEGIVVLTGSTVTGSTALFNNLTASVALFNGDIRVLGTASITQLNTIGQQSLVIGDKYITILSGGVDHTGINGSGFLWGTSSGPGETTGALGEHAHILYDSSRDALEIFPGLYVTGSTTLFDISGTTAQFTILTASNITGSTAMFTTLSSSNLIVSGGSAVIGDNAYVLYNPSIDKLAVFPGLYVTGAITASTIVNAPTGNFVVITGSTVTGTQAQFTSLTGTFVAPLGAVGTPSYTFIGDPNTGMFSPTADTLALVEGGTEVLRIDSSGRVGIATAGVGGPAQTLDINGTMRLRTLVAGTNAGFGRNPATGDITALTSDQRLKKEINTITSSLDSISRLRGVTFKWDDTRFNDFIIEETEREKTQIGLIAQEVEAVLPELVYNNGIQDLKSVRYAELVAVLIEGIKELSQEVNNLKTEIQTLKSGSI